MSLSSSASAQRILSHDIRCAFPARFPALSYRFLGQHLEFVWETAVHSLLNDRPPGVPWVSPEREFSVPTKLH